MQQVARLAKYQMVTIEKWYTPCGSKGPTQSGPSCAVEAKMETLFKKTRALNPKQTTNMCACRLTFAPTFCFGVEKRLQLMRGLPPTVGCAKNSTHTDHWPVSQSYDRSPPVCGEVNVTCYAFC